MITELILKASGPGGLYAVDKHGQIWAEFATTRNGKPYYATVCDRCGKRTHRGWRAINPYGGVRSCPNHISLLRATELEIA